VVGEHPAQRFVDGALVGPEHVHQVQVEGEAPQRSLDVDVRRPQVVDAHDVASLVPPIAVDRFPTDVAVGPAAGVAVHGEPSRRTVDQVTERAAVPPVRAVDPAGSSLGAGVGGGDDLHPVGAIDDRDRAWVVHRAGERAAVGLDLPVDERAGHAEPEPPVDRRLGGPQRRQHVAALAGVAQLAAHHRGEHAPAPVAGEHADTGDPSGRHLRASGHRGDERQPSGVAHHPIAIEGADRVAREERVAPLVGVLLRLGRDGEGGGEHDV
jgi:hypothetical protein